ncbi:MAG TPA: GrpB family protein [Mycobacteriales bacterium]|jgi:GrpB-like predicted nucleotidyltransferase (UPF0157 family)|nr:GrpB family protein [Mycobacteriales bacterium]
MTTSPGRSEPEPFSDDELRKTTLGEVTPRNAPIELAEYDKAWPALFTREAQRIRAVLGATALRIEHVGSTSVPGLLAKPIIDLLLVVPDSADEAAYVPALENAGYVLRVREPEWFEHRLFRGPDTRINLHVFTVDVTEIDRMLRFRDWLRRHDDDRDLYAQTKRELARRDWRHVEDYANAKTAVVQEIMSRAQDSRWEPVQR